ncbi:hypothetical protein ACOMHN_063325 [Nucella lapillus]
MFSALRMWGLLLRGDCSRRSRQKPGGRITEAYDEHQKLVKDLNSDKRKRVPDISEEPVEKKMKQEVVPAGPPEPPPTAPPPPEPAPVYPSYPGWGSYPSYPSYHSQWPSYPPPNYSSGYNYY